MTEVTTIGLDIAKHVFHAHGAHGAGRAMFSRRLTMRDRSVAALAGAKPGLLANVNAVLADLGLDVRAELARFIEAGAFVRVRPISVGKARSCQSSLGVGARLSSPPRSRSRREPRARRSCRRAGID